jgi:hypothetical protein
MFQLVNYIFRRLEIYDDGGFRNHHYEPAKQFKIPAHHWIASCLPMSNTGYATCCLKRADDAQLSQLITLTTEKIHSSSKKIVVKIGVL